MNWENKGHKLKMSVQYKGEVRNGSARDLCKYIVSTFGRNLSCSPIQGTRISFVPLGVGKNEKRVL